MAAKMLKRPARPPVIPPPVAPVCLVEVVERIVTVFVDADGDDLKSQKLVAWERICIPAESSFP